MAKIIKKSNPRVVIEADLTFPGLRKYPDDDRHVMCEEIVKQVKRHIDDIADVYVKYDTEEVCEFCGFSWETEDNGEPVCCNKAVEEWKHNLEACHDKTDNQSDQK